MVTLSRAVILLLRLRLKTIMLGVNQPLKTSQASIARELLEISVDVCLVLILLLYYSSGIIDRIGRLAAVGVWMFKAIYIWNPWVVQPNILK